ETRAWEREGFSSAAEHVAQHTGTSVGEARREIGTSKALPKLPETTAALTDGAISPAQAHVIADAASVNPDAEHELVDSARTDSHRDAKDWAMRHKAAAARRAADREARIRHQRSLRTYIDQEGAWTLHARGTVTDGHHITAAISAAVDDLFRHHRTTDPAQRD